MGYQKKYELPRTFLNLWKYLIAGVVMFIAVFKMNITVHTSAFSIALEVLLGVVIYMIMILILRPTILEKAKIIFCNRKKS